MFLFYDKYISQLSSWVWYLFCRPFLIIFRYYVRFICNNILQVYIYRHGHVLRTSIDKIKENEFEANKRKKQEWRTKVTDYFDIVAGVLQGDTLAPYLFIICLDYVLRVSIDKIKENGFQLTKERSKRYLTKTITEADYADDIALLAKATVQAETLLHNQEWAAAMQTRRL